MGMLLVARAASRMTDCQLTCQGEFGACHVAILGVAFPVFQLILRRPPLGESLWDLGMQPLQCDLQLMCS